MLAHRFGVLAAVSFCIFVVGCNRRDRDLRGESEPSPDGRTYLSIMDDNGGKCGGNYIDGKPWKHAIGEPGLISPGPHNIACGSDMMITLRKGFTYEFDYWGRSRWATQIYLRRGIFKMAF